MIPAARPVPEGFHSLTPHLIVKGAKKAIDFYRRAFGAETCFCNEIPGAGTVMHAQLRIGDSLLMLNDEFPDWGVLGPDPDGRSPVTIHLYVDDVDAAWQRAVDAGAEVVMPLENQFWGDRYGLLADPFGHRWSLAQRVEDLSPEEVEARSTKFFGGDGAG